MAFPARACLNEGDVVSIDTGCKLAGWCGDSAVTHPVGKIAPEVQRLLDVTSGVLELAIELIGRKRRWSEVAAEMGSYVRDHGFSRRRELRRARHRPRNARRSAGSQLRQCPAAPQRRLPIEPGLVIAVEPMVNMGSKLVKGMPDHWTQATQDGKPVLHFEHTIAMTDNGPWVLTGPPDEKPGQHVAASQPTSIGDWQLATGNWQPCDWRLGDWAIGRLGSNEFGQFAATRVPGAHFAAAEANSGSRLGKCGFGALMKLFARAYIHTLWPKSKLCRQLMP